MDKDEGVLSPRFVKAFFGELSTEASVRLDRSKTIYRQLSEYVHGNSETWESSGLAFSYNEALLESYLKIFDQVSEIILFVLCCRYLKSFSTETLDALGFISEELNHITAIREHIGGPEEIL
jgi:hypothetical protein